MNLKIYRKLFVLFVLSIGLFFAGSSKPTPAVTRDCCDICYNNYITCQNNCDPDDRDCVKTICLPAYNACKAACSPLICD